MLYDWSYLRGAPATCLLSNDCTLVTTMIRPSSDFYANYPIFAYMKKVLTVFLLAYLAVSILCSCTGMHSKLIGIESLMADHPDSALAELKKIDTLKLVSNATKAKYSLLYTMALDRNGIDTTNYSLLTDAVIYYDKHGPVSDKVKTSYYQGRLYFNNKEYGAALKSFLKALELSEAVDDNWIKGMICSLIAITHNENHNNADELKYHRMARDFFVLNGNPKYIDNSTFLLALACHNNKMFKEADSLYSCIPQNSPHYPSAILFRASNEISRPEPNAEKAVKYFKTASQLYSPFTVDLLYQYAYALTLQSDNKAANSLVSRLESYPQDAKTYWWRYMIATANKNTKQALDNLELYSNSANEYINTALSQSSYKAETDYYSALARQSEHKMLRNRMLLIISILFTVILVLLFKAVYQKRLLDVLHQKDSLEQSYYNLQDIITKLKKEQEDVQSTEQRAKELQSSYISMYRAQYASIGLFVHKDLSRSVLPVHIEEYVGQILHDIEAGDSNPALFESRVNRDLDNVIEKLKLDFPGFSPDNVRFLSYVFAGLKNSSIAVIMQESQTAISTRKSRLKKQILNSDTPNKELYEMLLA